MGQQEPAPDERLRPRSLRPETLRPLTPRESAKLRRWREQGERQGEPLLSKRRGR